MAEIIKVFEGQEITIAEDGMWNASAMCKKYNKLVADFFRLKQTKAYIEELKNLHKLTDNEVVRTVQGKGKQQGTWVHMEVALKLAAWLNPKIEVWVFATIRKLLVEGEVKLRNEIVELQNCLDISEYRLEESKAKTEYWHNEYSLYRHGYHPEYEEVGKFQEGDLQLGVPTEK
ncbi:KilA-N domain-containing protein [Okeania sp. KiyG1]|uniref:KilA-N domain-containing protein n=1 Tax=Okeania sp. KiyG1 TaxID=2720165 RepID=UPI0019226CDB|nr:KilA-N domain-containing protein [Okeania sp. KiyG1]GFZ93559.1 hypothetical protein CYANOKiyG1_04330 [Okeania sp. KiyG1]